MVDYWDEYKEMLFIGPFIMITFAGQGTLGGYFNYAFWGSIIFLVAGLFGAPQYSELQAGRRTVIRANVQSLFEYGGNSVLQFWYDKPGSPMKIQPDRWGNEWQVDQPLIEPFPSHPKYGKVKTLTYRMKHYPSVMLKPQKGKVYYKGSMVESGHVQLCTLYEYMSGPGIPVMDMKGPRPLYMAATTRGDYEMLVGRMRLSQVIDAEAEVSGN